MQSSLYIDFKNKGTTMKKLMLCLSVLLLTACNSTTNSNNDTVLLVNAKNTAVISTHKTEKECQAAKIAENIRSKAQWAQSSVANRSLHTSKYKLASCKS